MEKIWTRTQQNTYKVSRMQNAAHSVEKKSNSHVWEGSHVTQSSFKHLTNKKPMKEKLVMQILVLLDLRRKMLMHKHIHTNIVVWRYSAFDTVHSKQFNIKHLAM